MSFLPKDYQVPTAESGYMRLITGENKFRIMSSPLLGYEWWEDKDGKRVPYRVGMDVDIPVAEITNPEEIKHFWAMVVWNYTAKKLQILQITQKTIQRAIRALAKSEDWGDPKGPKGYDILVTREGEKLETEYTVNPTPKKALELSIVNAYKEADIDLTALFRNEDPFELKVDLDEVDKD